MDAMERPLHTMGTDEVDSYIDSAIDRLFVPRAAHGRGETPANGDSASGVADEAISAGQDVEEAGGVLESLQEAVLSLDWEVSERNIGAFGKRVRELAANYPDDKHVAAVAQMAAEVCRYLSALGEAASPVGVQFPGATVSTLQTLLGEPPPSASQRRSAVEQLLEKYRRLQSEVRRRREPTRSPAESKPVSTEAPHAEEASETDALQTMQESGAAAAPLPVDEGDGAARVEVVEEVAEVAAYPGPGVDDDEELEELEPMEAEARAGDSASPLVLEAGEPDSSPTTAEPSALQTGDPELDAPGVAMESWPLGAEEVPWEHPVSVAADECETPLDDVSAQTDDATPEYGLADATAEETGDSPTEPLARALSAAGLQTELSAIRETLNGLVDAVGRIEAHLAFLSGQKD